MKPNNEAYTQSDEINRLNKIIDVLMDRAEHGLNTDSSDFSLFQTTIALEEKVQSRTLELKETLDKLAQTNDKLDHSLHKLEETQDQLVESKKMAALGALVAGVAHEINTPIGIGITASSLITQEIKELKSLLISENLSQSKLEQFLDIIEESSDLTTRNLQRVGNLVSDFKEVAVNQRSMKKRQTRINHTIQNACIMLAPTLTEQKVVLIPQFGPEIDCQTYESAIDQIITNLITNTLNHAFHQQEAGIINISTKLENQQVEILFSDNGKGIEAHLIEKIFEPFYTTRRGSGGMGLGLHIIYNLVTEILAGKIHCTSQLNQGTQFTITFPVEFEAK